MRIALDATPLSIPTGGVRRYTEELSRALAQEFPRDEFWLVSDQQFSHPAPELANLKAGCGPKNAFERRWWLWGLRQAMSRVGINVFHGTDFSVPYLGGRPAVMTLHDASPWLDLNWHAAGRVRRRTPLLIRLGLATMLITPSEAVRAEAISRFHVPPERVVAIPLAASAHFRPVVREPERAPYFLYVGTLEPRKNLTFLIAAWREVRKTIGVDLVLAGRMRADSAPIAPEPGLGLSGAVSDADLPGLYSNAVAFLYPSLYEGFGLPVLEAMQCGAAVITSRDAAIGEVCGDAAVRLDAADARAWINAMATAATNPEWRAQQGELAMRRAAGFSWRRTAKLTREVYDEAAARFDGNA